MQRALECASGACSAFAQAVKSCAICDFSAENTVIGCWPACIAGGTLRSVQVQRVPFDASVAAACEACMYVGSWWWQVLLDDIHACTRAGGGECCWMKRKRQAQGPWLP